jgi:hypothetical protein
MGLVACPDCGKNFSDAASQCPNCGRPAKKPSMLTKDIGVAGMLYTLFLAGGLIAAIFTDNKLPGVVVAGIAAMLLAIRLRTWVGVGNR